MRRKTYSKIDADVGLICFAVNKPESFDSLVNKWIPEFQIHWPGRPYFIIATKVDVRDNGSAPNCVKTEVGQKLAFKKGALKCLECSALTGEGVGEIFIEVLPIHH
jgi:Rho family protein